MPMIDFDVKKNMSAFAYYYAKARKMNKINDILVVKRLASNWYDAILFRAHLKKSFVMELRNGKRIQIKSIDDYNNFWESEESLAFKLNMLKIKGYKIDLDKKAQIIEIEKFENKIKFYYDDLKQALNTLGMIDENFCNEQYASLNVEGKDVVDIGANIGDSAIYFALKGAKHVYAFEPYPYSYNLAKKNIQLNSLNDKITLLNEGCSMGGFVTIKDETKNYGGTDLKSFKSGKKIKISSLDEIVDRFKLQNAALKIDCEGCEYATILNTKNETLLKFDRIIMEYHYGYKNLEKKFKDAGFKVRHTAPRYFYNTDAENKSTYFGLIIYLY